MATGRGPARRRRDRRGRGIRGHLVPPHLPAHRTAAGRFDDLVVDAVDRLSRRWGEALEAIDVVVEEVPSVDPPVAGTTTALGRAVPAASGARARIVVHRRPIVTRADEDLPRLVHLVVVEQLAALLGRTPEEVDPDWDWDPD